MEPEKGNAGVPLARSLDAPSLASSSTDANNDPAKPFMSKGEKIHKWGTYLGVDWIFNAAAGVGFAYWGKYTKMGQKYFSGPVRHGFETALKPIIKDPHSLKSSVEYGNMFVSIITGGMFTIPPLMVLENNENKKSIAKWLDNRIYGQQAVEQDPRFEESYKRILEEPKKDFLTGMGSRFVALSPLLASVLFPPTRNLLDKHYFHHITRASTSLSTKAGLGAEKLFTKLPKAEALERNAFIHNNFALDFGFGVPYAILHSVFYDKFANEKGEAGKAEENGKKWADTLERRKPVEIAGPAPQAFTQRLTDKPAGMEHQLI